jgi:hypothetical protein
LLVAEEIGKTDGSALTLEPVVLCHLAARRQRAALFCHALDVTPEFDFLRQQRVARPSIFPALVGKSNRILFRQLSRRRKWCVGRHVFSPLFRKTR